MGNLLFTFALARRLEGSGVTVNAFHPGIVRTGLMNEVRGPMQFFVGLLNLFGAVPAAVGETLASLAAANSHGNHGQLLRGTKPMQAAAYARDEAVQERVWAISSQLVGLPA
jgi:NAD(P)-dependent dehydrogenase (short-subunit alcohol dehydrogenase family)